MNARGAFTPHEVEEYAVDKRYPGYMLSHEPSSVTLDQLHREKPKMFLPNGQVDWDVSIGWIRHFVFLYGCSLTSLD